MKGIHLQPVPTATLTHFHPDLVGNVGTQVEE